MATPRLAPDTLNDRSVLLTAEEVSRQVGVSTSFLYTLAREGKLPHHRFGSLVRFVLEEVLAATRVEAQAGPSCDMTFDELAAHFGLA